MNPLRRSKSRDPQIVPLARPIIPNFFQSLLQFQVDTHFGSFERKTRNRAADREPCPPHHTPPGSASDLLPSQEPVTFYPSASHHDANHRSVLERRVILRRSGGLFFPRIPFLRRAKVPGKGSFRGKHVRAATQRRISLLVSFASFPLTVEGDGLPQSCAPVEPVLCLDTFRAPQQPAVIPKRDAIPRNKVPQPAAPHAKAAKKHGQLRDNRRPIRDNQIVPC